jgi:hypothetical protein
MGPRFAKINASTSFFYTVSSHGEYAVGCNCTVCSTSRFEGNVRGDEIRQSSGGITKLKLKLQKLIPTTLLQCGANASPPLPGVGAF